MRNRLSIAHWISLYALNLILCYLAGKDYNWDLLNYHFYGPALLLEGRWDQDYFAGSIQSYLNPIAYVPFFLMVKWGWPALLIGLVLSTLHFLNIVVIGSISEKLFSNGKESNRTLVYVICLLAMAAPPYLQSNGSTFNDPYGSFFILVGVRILLQDELRIERQAMLVGICSGIAVGIKLTNAMFAISFALVFMAAFFFRRPIIIRGLAKQLICYGLAVVLAFIVVHGFWSFRLWQEFGSPVYPFFNAIFKASEFQFVNIRDLRFLGSGTPGLLMLPFDMLKVQSWIYSEAASPDVRPTGLVVLATAAVFGGVWRLLCSRSSVQSPKRNVVAAHQVVARCPSAAKLVAFVFVSFLLWGVTSRIGRYAFSLWLLLGPLLGLAALSLGGVKVARIALGVVLGLQGYIHFAHGSQRWAPVAWESAWLDFQLPQALTQQPVGVISIDTLSFSAIVPSLHPESGMATISGMHTMSNGAEMPARLTSLIDRYRSKLYLLYAIGQFPSSYKPQISAKRINILNEKMAPYGLTISSAACEYGTLPFDRKVHDWSPGPSVMDGFVFAFCRLSETSPSQKEEAVSKSRAKDSIFDSIEDKCPDVFSPKRVVTIHHDSEYVRSYFNTASSLYTDKEAIYMTGYRVLFPTYVGALNEILEKIKLPDFICPSLPAHRYLAD